jgi:hypothetical protein
MRHRLENDTMILEEKRIAELKVAQTKAKDLFHKVASRGLIRPGDHRRGAERRDICPGEREIRGYHLLA